MPLAVALQNDSDLRRSIETPLKELRQEYYGRAIDENDIQVKSLEKIIHILKYPDDYQKGEYQAFTNHVIIDRLLDHKIISVQRHNELKAQFHAPKSMKIHTL